MSSGPKVYGNGSITLAIDGDDVCVFAGQKKIGLAQSLRLNAIAGQKPSLEVIMLDATSATHGGEDLGRKIEEESRVLQLFPWIRVIRS